MVKGVSKQIVEVIHTENEYFEKAILFVNPEKFELENHELKEQADLFVNTYLTPKRSSRIFTPVLWNLLKIGGGALGGALTAVLLLTH